MVPGHPPCALCSLIFSSCDPETNFFSTITPPRGDRNWPLLNLLAVQLSRCGLRDRFRFPPSEVIRGSPLKTIQSSSRVGKQLRCSAFLAGAYHALRVLFNNFWKSYSPCDRRYPSLIRIRSEPWTAVAWEALPKSKIWTLPQSTWNGFRLSTSALSLERR